MAKPIHGKLDSLAITEPAAGVARRTIPVGSGGFAQLVFDIGSMVAKHSHDPAELILVHKGRLLVTVETRVGRDEYILGPGDYLVIPGKAAHTLSAMGKRETRASLFHARGSVAAGDVDVI